ncbi:MAG: hypothetical protein ACM3YM_05450 [Sphingomonadales bacterium]
MIGRIVGAVVGERIAWRHGSGAKGALIGAAAPVLARRLMGPLGLALAGGYVAKKYYDRRKQVRVG